MQIVMKYPLRFVSLILLLMLVLSFVCAAADCPHVWGTPSFSWSADCRSAEAVRVCASCGTSETAAATVLPNGRGEATCTEEGYIGYIAYAAFDGKSINDVRVTVVPMSGHQYGSPVFEWGENSKTCAALLICTVCDESEYTDCAVTESAGPNPGDISYIASVTVGGNTYTDTMTISAPPHVHNYSLPEIRWISDEEAVAVSICSHCAADAPEKVISIPCDVSKETVDATCSAPGKTVFTAKAEVNGIPCEDTRTVTHEKLAHTYESPAFIWNGSACTYRCRCTVGGEVLTDACRVTEKTTPATCFSAGMRVYTAIAKINGKDYTDTLTVSIPALDHQYSEPVFAWGESSKTCTAAVVCVNCDETEIVNCTVTQADGQNAGDVIYTAKITVGGQTYTDAMTVSAPPIETHSYSIPEIGWNSDHSATAISICSHCGMDAPEKVISVPCEVTKETVEATCRAAGKIIYTAKAVINGFTCTDSKTVPVPKLEHIYTEPVFTWDGEICSYRYSCTVGGEIREGYCTVTKTDDTTSGETVCTASVSVGGHVYTDKITVPAPPPSAETHSYSTPEIRWSEDYKSAAAFSVCSHCDDNAPEKTVYAACKVTETVTPATCSSDGEIVYTAQATVNGVPCGDRKTVSVPRLPHHYTLPVFTWDGVTCTFAYSCTVGNETHTGECRITETIENGTCTEPGMAVYTASVHVNDKVYTDEMRVERPANGHTDSRLPGTAATCTEAGITDGIVCSVCGEVLLEGFPIEPLEHAFRTAEFTVHDDGSITAVKHCANNCGETLGGTVTVTVPDQNHPEQVIAQAVFPDGTTAQTSLTIALPEEEIPDIPDTPGVPDAPATPDIPDAPDIPVAPDVPVTPDVPVSPIVPDIPEEPETPDIPQFSDVPADSYYNDAVIWAAQTGITHGTGEGIFSPDMICTRAQVVTMLWRAAGSPETESKCSFEDVPDTAYYVDAVAWAAEMGITVGTSATTFSPDLLCTRAQILTMLWRAAGCPGVKAENAFSDVSADAYYASAVAWAVKYAITNGTGSNTFSPDAPCSRAQIVTFLWRAERNQ